MINIDYSQNNKAQYLFPNAQETGNIDFAIKNRLKKYLNQDEYDWAYQFVKTIMEHKDYYKIKEELRRTRITDLRKYHDCLQTSLNDSKTNNSFLNTLIDFNQIIRKTDMITSRMLYIDINFSSILSKKDIEHTLNLFGYYLFQEDSPIIAEIQHRYLEEVKKYQNNKTLQSIIQLEYSSIEKKAFELYRQYIGKYNMAINLEKNQSIDNHISERYSKLLRIQIHEKGIK